MTGAAIRARLVLPMAGNAARHGEIRLSPQRIAGFDGTVTFGARKPRLRVNAMAELNEVRHLVYGRPWDGFVPMGVRFQLLNLGLLLRNREVTRHAFRNRR